MATITAEHKHWYFYNQLRKCGELTVSGDLKYFGLNCNFCSTICLHLDSFINHIKTQHVGAVQEDYFAVHTNVMALPGVSASTCSPASYYTNPNSFQGGNTFVEQNAYAGASSHTEIPVDCIKEEIKDSTYDGAFIAHSEATEEFEEAEEDAAGNDDEDMTNYNMDESNDDTQEMFQSSKSSPTASSNHSGPASRINSRTRRSNQILFGSGKYFYIIERLTKTEHHRSYGGLVAACHNCTTKIKGSLRVSSNFMCHMRIKHPDRLEEFLNEKKECSKYGANKRKENPTKAELNKTNLKNKMNTKYINNMRLIEEEFRECQQMVQLNQITNHNESNKKEKKKDETTKLRGAEEEEKHKINMGEFETMPVEQRQQQQDIPSNDYFNSIVLKFLINTLTSFEIVENDAFRNLFAGTERILQSSNFYKNLFKIKWSKHSQRIKEKIPKQRNFFTTIDIWTECNFIFFFGYTCHWINADFRRESQLLRCQRMKESKCTQRDIEELITQINREFGINEENIICTTFANGRNGAKNFQYLKFGLENDNNDAVDDVTKVEEELQEFSIYERIKFPEISFNTSSNSNLLNHVKFNQDACNQLSLIITTDYIQILESSTHQYIRGVHMKAIKRCTLLLQKCNLIDNEEIIEEVLATSLRTPVLRKWNNIYSAIKTLLKQSQTKLDELCTKICVEKFDSHEFGYLREWLMLMEPLAHAEEFLQNTNYNYFGYFLPTLVTVKVKLNKLHASKSLHLLHQVCAEILECLLRRFAAYFAIHNDVHDAVVAALTCPGIKTRFLAGLKDTAPDFKWTNVIELLLSYGMAFQKVNDDCGTEETSDYGNALSRESVAASGGDDFFDFGDCNDTNSNSAGSVNLATEIEMYLGNTCTTFESLKSYPTIMQLFYKFNTPLPAPSACVERLLPFAKIAENADRLSVLDNEEFNHFIILHSLKEFHEDEKEEYEC